MRNKIPKLAADRGMTTREFLIELMERHRYQRDAAHEIGVSQPTLSQWLIREKILRSYTPLAQTEEKKHTSN